MQNNSSENSAPAGLGKVVKFALMGFVILSVAAAGYKMLGAPCCSASKAAELPAAPAAAAAAPDAPAAVKPEVRTPVAVKKAAEEKTALVYYFYTNTRCSSCKTIEAYTKETVKTNFTTGYKGWTVVFKGVNLDEQQNAHFKQDYWLNSKSVVVQKFSGEKALKWAKLDQVWQLLGDKDAFTAYITAETRKLLDEK